MLIEPSILTNQLADSPSPSMRRLVSCQVCTLRRVRLWFRPGVLRLVFTRIVLFLPFQATWQAVQASSAPATAEVGVGSTGCLLWQSVMCGFMADGVGWLESQPDMAAFDLSTDNHRYCFAGQFRYAPRHRGGAQLIEKKAMLWCYGPTRFYRSCTRMPEKGLTLCLYNRKRRIILWPVTR